jgi:hypothetical protein
MEEERRDADAVQGNFISILHESYRTLEYILLEKLRAVSV